MVFVLLTVNAHPYRLVGVCGKDPDPSANSSRHLGPFVGTVYMSIIGKDIGKDIGKPIHDMTKTGGQAPCD